MTGEKGPLVVLSLVPATGGGGLDCIPSPSLTLGWPKADRLGVTLGVAPPNLKIGLAAVVAGLAGDATSFAGGAVRAGAVGLGAPKARGLVLVAETSLFVSFAVELAVGKAANGLEGFVRSMTGVESGAGVTAALPKLKLGAASSGCLAKY